MGMGSVGFGGQMDSGMGMGMGAGGFGVQMDMGMGMGANNYGG